MTDTQADLGAHLAEFYVEAEKAAAHFASVADQITQAFNELGQQLWKQLDPEGHAEFQEILGKLADDLRMMPRPNESLAAWGRRLDEAGLMDDPKTREFYQDMVWATPISWVQRLWWRVRGENDAV